MENLSQKEVDYSIAKERVKQMKKYYTNVVIFIIVFSIYGFQRYYLNGDISFLNFDHFSGVFWIWGIILAIKGVKIFFLNQSWERRIMDKELKQNQNGNY